jgi:hypothetical protein
VSAVDKSALDALGISQGAAEPDKNRDKVDGMPGFFYVWKGAFELLPGAFLTSIGVSSRGDVAISARGENVNETVLDELSGWNYDRLDSLCAGYSFRKFGQAYTIVDLLARYGEISFSDESHLTSSISRSMRRKEVTLLQE